MHLSLIFIYFIAFLMTFVDYIGIYWKFGAPQESQTLAKLIYLQKDMSPDPSDK